MEQIRTTGDLRKILGKLIVDVRSGAVGLEQATRITKVAAQINESFYSEMKVKQVLMEAGEQSAELGRLNLTADSAIAGEQEQ